MIKTNSRFIMRGFEAAVLLVVLIVLIFSTASYAIVPGENALVSTTSSGSQSNGNSLNPKISKDGESVAFESVASNLVANDTNSKQDIFVKNLRSGSISRVSVSSSGAQANGASSLESISETGRYLTFKSEATNLIDGQSNIANHNYLYDTKTQQTTLLTVRSNGTPMTSGMLIYTKTVGVSSDGRFVVMQGHNYSGLIANAPDASGYRIYQLDRAANLWKFLDKTPNNTWQNNKSSNSAVTSCDGAITVFKSDATDLTTSQNPNYSGSNLYMSDIRNGEPKVNLISTTANAETTYPSISCNGNYVTFSSAATNLVSEVSSGSLVHYYRYDLVDDSYALIDKKTDGTVADLTVVSSPNYRPDISDNGDVVFMHNSRVGDLSGNPMYTMLYPYLRDFRNQQTLNLDKKADGSQAIWQSHASSVYAISADGRIAVGVANDNVALVANDSNGFGDIVTMKTGL